MTPEELVHPQPDPIAGPDVGVMVWPAALEHARGTHAPSWLLRAMEARHRFGQKKYKGVALRCHNGRNPAVDLFQELLDGYAYATQLRYEACSMVEHVIAQSLQAMLLGGLILLYTILPVDEDS